MSSKEHSNHDTKVDSRQQSSQPTVQDRAAITGHTAPAAIVQPARCNPESLTPGDVLQLHGAIGNQAVQRLLRRTKPDGQKAHPSTEEIPPFDDDFSRTPAYASSRPGIQAKLTVSSPGDSYEQEANRVSEQVMGGPETRLQRACECGGSECAECRNGHAAAHDQLQINRSQANDPGGMAAPDIVHEVLNSPGQSLDSSTQGFMESRFGHDFGGVRVHADARAARSADTVQAHAYTVGEDMVFGAGRYAPASDEGKSLIAHELAHVVQQRRAPVDAGVVEPAGSPAEREAEVAASVAARPQPRRRLGAARSQILTGWGTTRSSAGRARTRHPPSTPSPRSKLPRWASI